MSRDFATPSPLATLAAMSFVQEWLGGGRPRIEDALNTVPPSERANLFESLLTAEVNARKARGEAPDAGEYAPRFPQFRHMVEASLGLPRVVPPMPAAVPASLPAPLPYSPAVAGIPVAPLPAGVAVMPVATAMYAPEPRTGAFAFGEMPEAAPAADPMGNWEEKQTRKLGWLIGLSFLGIIGLGVVSAVAVLPKLRDKTPVEAAPELVEGPPPEAPKNAGVKTETKDIDMGGPKSTGDSEKDLVDWLRDIGGSGFVLTEQGGRVRYSPGQNMPKTGKFTVDQISLVAETANRWNDRSVARFAELKDLKRLELHRDKDLTDDTLTPLVATAKLRHLELRGLDLKVTGAGIARFPDLESLVVNTAPGFGDADCGAIGKLQNLTSLELNGTKITPVGFGHLGKLPKLTTLTFGADLTLSPDSIRVLQTAPIEEIRSANGLADEVFAEFAVFPNVRRYHLRKTLIKSSGFKAVAGQVKLEDITIVDSEITGDALKHLAELTALTTLDLSNSKVEGPGLSELAKLPNVKVIRLAGCPILDKDAALLAPADTMEELDLSRTKITDGALAALKKHQKLKRLILKGTMVTAGGIKEFVAGTPQCKVEK